mgnify:CR=1 FL=1
MPPQECFHGIYHTALAQMLDRITPLNATETVPLLQAFSRVTAHDIVSPLDVPGFDNAAMDGYAVRLNDLRDGAALPVAIEPLQVVGIALAAMAIALLSTLYPSWRAAATQPAEALRYE